MSRLVNFASAEGYAMVACEHTDGPRVEGEPGLRLQRPRAEVLSRYFVATEGRAPRLQSSTGASKAKRTRKTKRDRTPSFVCELPLRVPLLGSLGGRLAAKLEAARQVYNACLGEALRRLGLVRQSVWFARGRATPRQRKQERQAHFQAARDQHGFSDAGLQQYGIRLRSKDGTGPKAPKTWLGKHLGAHEVQTLATRAYRGANDYLLGRHGRPRFKGKGRLHSVEGKGPGSGLRWTDQGLLVWGELVLRPILDPEDPVVRHALCARVKYARIVRRRVRLRTRWYVQLVCAGQPYRKVQQRTTDDGATVLEPQYPLGRGTVGLDFGPSTLATVGEKEAMLVPFCPGVAWPARAMRRLQRHIDRQRRANNPGNYLPDGRVRPGPKRWRVSVRQRQTEGVLAETHRRLAEGRKTAQGTLANRVLGMGDVFQVEKVSLRAFQRAFGRSVGLRAPGLFVERLSRKAESAGGKVIAFPTRTTALSQACHCGRRKKKPLSLRWHECPCGASAQRDLFSAHLARFVYQAEDGRHLLDAGRAAEAWPGAGCGEPEPRPSGQRREATWAEPRLDGFKRRSGTAPACGVRAGQKPTREGAGFPAPPRKGTERVACARAWSQG